MILASASPRRAELLEGAGFEVVVRPSEVDERPLAGEGPVALVERLARRKAGRCLADDDGRAEGSVILAADTMVWAENVTFGKPRDGDDARRMLRALSGRTHHVSTGVCVILGPRRTPGGRREGAGPATSFVETTDVTFYDLSDDEIDAYVETGEPMDKAGAYGIQGVGRLLVRGVSGDYFNVVGLPVARVAREVGYLLDGPRSHRLTTQCLEARHAS